LDADQEDILVGTVVIVQGDYCAYRCTFPSSYEFYQRIGGGARCSHRPFGPFRGQLSECLTKGTGAGCIYRVVTLRRGPSLVSGRRVEHLFARGSKSGWAIESFDPDKDEGPAF
jgi:hypothetical protein